MNTKIVTFILGLWLICLIGSGCNKNGTESGPETIPLDGRGGGVIAFNSGPFREWEVYIINADGTNMRQVTDSPTNITAINPVWQPE